MFSTVLMGLNTHFHAVSFANYESMSENITILADGILDVDTNIPSLLTVSTFGKSGDIAELK